MNTLHDELQHIERRASASFGDTTLAAGHGAITRKVRRHRTVRAGVGTLAGVGVVGAAGLGFNAVLGDSAAMPGASSTATGAPVSTTAPTPSEYPTSSATEDDVTDTVMVVPSGKTADEVLEGFAALWEMTPQDAELAFDAALPPQATGIEGWIAPGEWQQSDFASADEMAAAMVQSTQEALLESGIEPARWHEVLTRASLVEKEALLAADMPHVAAVISNRIEAGMPLQLDSTVRYAVGTEDGNVFLSSEHLEVDSPYNTYANIGLPPGPIATVSVDAIGAVAMPLVTDDLYFLVVNLTTGEMRFAQTYEEHVANVEALNEWLDEQQQQQE